MLQGLLRIASTFKYIQGTKVTRFFKNQILYTTLKLGEEKESSRIKREEKICEISTSYSFSDSLSFIRSYPPIKLKDIQKYS